MRLTVVLLIVCGLFAAGQSQDFAELGKGLLDSLVNQGKSVLGGLVKSGTDALQKLISGLGKRQLDLANIGKSLVSSLVDQGKAVLGGLVQKGTDALQKLLSGLGKRDLGDFLKGITSSVANLLDHGKAIAGKAFGLAVNKLKELTDKFHQNFGVLKSADDYVEEVEDIVAEHHVQQRRFLGDLIQKGKDLLGNLFNKAKEFAGSLKGIASNVVSGLLQKGTDLLVGKRATLGEHLKNIGGVLSKAFSPFKDIVAGVGNTLKGHFSNLVDKVKGHVSALAGKLSGHVSDLKTHGKTLLEHGKNALGALGEVVGDIVKQTLGNAKPALDGLSKTLAGAGKTVLNHFTGADKTGSF